MSKETFTIRDKRANRRYFIDNDLLRCGYGKVLGAAGIAVYNALVLHADSDTQKCYPSYATIAELSGISRRWAIKKVHQLEMLHIIRRVERRYSDTENASNLYYLLDKDEWLDPSELNSPPSELSSPPSEPSSPEQDPSEQDSTNKNPTPPENQPAAEPLADEAPPEEPPPNTTDPPPGSWEAIEQSPRPKGKRKTRRRGNPEHRAMYAALVWASQIDDQNERNQGMINAEAKAILDADWHPPDIQRFMQWWLADDWRREHTPVPSIKTIREKIRQAHNELAEQEEATHDPRFG